MKTAEEIWQKLLIPIQESTAKETFELWFSPLKPVSLENNILTIQVPNKYFSEWLKQNYNEMLEKNLSEFLGAPATIVYQESQDISSVIKKVEIINREPAESSYILESNFNPDYTFENLVTGQFNRFAKGTCEAVAKEPGTQFNPVFIYSNVGLGKTHLLHAIGNYIRKNRPELKVLYVTCEKFINDFIDSIKYEKPASFRNKYRHLDCLLIDDIQFLVGKQSSQEEFFYTFNTLYNSRKQIVVTSDCPPKDIPTLEERLISRFEWGVITPIDVPDFESRKAILVRKAEQNKINIANDVLTFLATEIKSNIRELEGSLIRLAAFAAFTETPLTVDTAKKILRDIIKPDKSRQPVTIEKIQRIVAQKYNLEPEQLKARDRSESVALARQIAMYLCRTLSDEFSTTTIGEAFGGKDHTTVIHACNKIKRLLQSDPFFMQQINGLIQKIYEG